MWNCFYKHSFGNQTLHVFRLPHYGHWFLLIEILQENYWSFDSNTSHHVVKYNLIKWQLISETWELELFFILCMLMMAFSNGFAPVLEYLYNIKKYTTSGYYVIFAAGCQSIALCGLEKNWEKLNWIQCTPLCNQNGFDATTSIICDAANSRVVELSRWYCLPEMTLAKNLHVLKWATRYTTPAWASWRPVHGFVRSNE